jgi:hypothetical protein
VLVVVVVEFGCYGLGLGLGLGSGLGQASPPTGFPPAAHSVFMSAAHLRCDTAVPRRLGHICPCFLCAPPPIFPYVAPACA